MAAILADALSTLPPDARPACLPEDVGIRYGQSLDTFIRRHIRQPNGQGSPTPETASAHWLAVCVAEAAQRFAAREDPSSPTGNEYEGFLSDACSVISRRFHDELSEEQYQQCKEVIERGLASFRQEMRDRISAYQSDMLCPAFRTRGAVSPEAASTIKEWIRTTSLFPAYAEPTEILVSQRGRFVSKVNSFCRRTAVNLCLVQMFIGDVKPLVLKTPYWGHMDYLCKSVATEIDENGIISWPVHMTKLAPDIQQNALTKWRRE